MSFEGIQLKKLHFFNFVVFLLVPHVHCGVKKSLQSLLNLFQSFCLWFPFPFQLIVNKTQLGNESNGNIDLTAIQTIIAIINEFGFDNLE